MRALSGLLVLVMAACAGPAGGRALPSPVTGAERSAVERSVWDFIIQTHGQGAVLRDSTSRGPSHCSPGDPPSACAPPSGVPAQLWSAYLAANPSRQELRPLLSADSTRRFASEVDESGVECTRRSPRLEMSRVGLDRRGTMAIVSYVLWIPMNHLGCGAISGAEVLLRRDGKGRWHVVQPLSATVS